jgi:hypothetical protein
MGVSCDILFGHFGSNFLVGFLEAPLLGHAEVDG